MEITKQCQWGLLGLALLVSLSFTHPPVAYSEADKSTQKLTKAILALHSRLSSLEKENAALQKQVSQQQARLNSQKQSIQSLQTKQEFDRNSIKTLHERLNIIDSRSGSIVFPD